MISFLKLYFLKVGAVVSLSEFNLVGTSLVHIGVTWRGFEPLRMCFQWLSCPVIYVPLFSVLNGILTSMRGPIIGIKRTHGQERATLYSATFGSLGETQRA